MMVPYFDGTIGTDYIASSWLLQKWNDDVSAIFTFKVNG